MNSDMEIKITIHGGGVSAGGVQVGAASAAPVPSAAMGGAGALSAGLGGAVPSPVAGMGAAQLGAAAAPSPTMGGTLSGAMSGAATGSALPTPVPLDQIERLSGGSSTGTGRTNRAGRRDGSGAPTPEGDPQ